MTWPAARARKQKSVSTKSRNSPSSKPPSVVQIRRSKREPEVITQSRPLRSQMAGVRLKHKPNGSDGRRKRAGRPGCRGSVQLAPITAAPGMAAAVADRAAEKPGAGELS